MRLNALIWPNRACDPKKEDIIERSYPFFDPVWKGERAESWYLEALAVRPDFQGKGVGRALVQWGLRRAEDDGVCASVISAFGKDGFYRKSGFDVQYWSAGMGDGNPLANVDGGNMFWKMPATKP
jgi:GNAT superfamily N-acetyltransferase